MVKIVQLLCPLRHCLLMGAYQEGVGSFEETRDGLKAILAPAGPFNNWCAICGSRDIHFEEAATRFKTLLEAAPHSVEQMEANVQTRAALEKAGLTYDQNRRN